MANEVLWKAPTTATEVGTGFDNVASAGMSNLGGSNEIANATSKKRYLSLRVRFKFGTAPATGRCLKVWILTEHGTTYEDPGSGSTEPTRAPDVVIPCAASTSQQEAVVSDIPIPPQDLRILVKNDTDQATDSTTDTNQVWEARYSEEVQ